MKKDVRQLCRKAREQGWSVETTQNNHIRLVSPTGEVTYTGGSPSASSAYRNLRASLKRMGLQV